MCVRLFLFCLCGLPLLGQTASLYDFELKSLVGVERVDLRAFSGLPSALMFFEPECAWCYRQVKAFNRLQAVCPGHFQPLAIGVNGSRRALRAEVQRFKPEFPAFQSSAALTRVVGEIPGTPFTLLSDANGQPLGWLRGYVAPDQLRPLLEQKFGFKCP